MQFRFGSGFALVTCLLLGACDGSGESYAIDVAPGAVEIFRVGPARQGDMFSQGVITLHVVDAVRDGDNVFVVVRLGQGAVATFHQDPLCISACTHTATVGSAGGGSGEVLLVSRDRGATWTQEPLPLPPHGPTGGTSRWHMSFGLHAHGGRAMHVVVQNGEWTQYGFVPFDPETLEHEPTAELDMTHVPVAPRAVSDHVSAWGQWQYGLAQNYHALHISMATGQVTSDVIASSVGGGFEGGPPLPYLNLAESGDGVSWMGVHYREPYCRHPASATAAMPGAGICVDQGSWPRSFSEVADLHAFGEGGTMALLAEHDERAYAMTFPALTVYDLGPGAPGRLNGLHPRFGGAMLVASDQGQRFAVVRDDALVELPFPTAPCRSGASCAKAGLAFALPLGDDEWLLIHTVDAGQPGFYDYRLYASTHHIEPLPFEVEPGPDGTPTSPIPFYPTATPAGSLERACHAKVSCTGVGDLHMCMGEWAGIRPDCPALERFLAIDPTAPEACTEYAAARPDPTCFGPDPSAAICTEVGSRCNGMRLEYCSGVGVQPSAMDCTHYGLVCGPRSDTGGYGCVPEVPDEEVDCGPSASWVECTNGRYLSWCSTVHARHWIDCQEIGASGCEEPGIRQHASCSR